jgi:hypothetical protein
MAGAVMGHYELNYEESDRQERERRRESGEMTLEERIRRIEKALKLPYPNVPKPKIAKGKRRNG